MEDALIRVRLTPRSAANEVSGFEQGVFRIRVSAPPVQGRANQALITLLSKALGVPKSRVEIVSGERSRDKKVRVRGMAGQEVRRALGVMP